MKANTMSNGFALGFALLMFGFASIGGVSFGAFLVSTGVYLLVRTVLHFARWSLQPVEDTSYEPEEG